MPSVGAAYLYSQIDLPLAASSAAMIDYVRNQFTHYVLEGLKERAQALDQDIHVARWTYDPLVARNAWFNLGKLGAVADRFGRSFYGDMTDEINRGDRTDRLVIRWDLDPEPGPRGGPGDVPTVLSAKGDAERPEPARPSEQHHPSTPWH